MIPKIAWFHWEGPPLSWLRWAGIRSFERQNPTWEIRIVRSRPETERPNLSVANRADWTSWINLYEYGGVKIDTDTLFVKPIPDDWLSMDLCCCLDAVDRGETHIRLPLHIGLVGASPRLPFMGRLVSRCETLADKEPAIGYESFGALAIRRVCMAQNVPGTRTFSYRKSVLTHYDENRVDELWGKDDLELPPQAVGIHWYGGHLRSKMEEPLATPYRRNFLCRTARKAS